MEEKTNISSATIEQIESIEATARQEAKAIHARDYLTTKAKTDRIAATYADAVTKAESAVSAARAELAERADELRPQRHAPTAIRDQDAPKLLYLQGVLTARWKGQEPSDILTEWRAAVDSGDVLTARVYRDNVESFLFAERRPAQETAHIMAEHAELDARTLDIMTPDETKQALAELDAVESELATLDRDGGRLLEKLRGTVYNPSTGEIVDGVLAKVRSYRGRQIW